MRLRLRKTGARLNPRASTQEYLLLLVAAVVQAFTFNLFLAPSDIAPGGVSGVALIISHYTGLPPGMLMLALSAPLLAFGFYHLGRFRFLVRTLLVTVIYTTGVDLLAPWLPAGGITGEPLLMALFGGVVGGIASGLAFKGRGTFAGTGIISRIVQLKTGLPITQLYMMIDGAVIVALGLVFGWENALYALIMLFVWGLATDYALEGPSVVRTAFIITDKPHQVSESLIQRMGIGVTAWQGQGMFTESERTVLFCTISRPDVGTLNNIVSETDRDAFVVIGQGHSARGGVLRPSLARARPEKSLAAPQT